MLSLFWKYATTRRVGKVGIVVAIGSTTTYAFYQALGLRKKYVDSPKLEPPLGPVQGLERFHRLLQSDQKVIMTILQELKTKVTRTLETKTDDLAQRKSTLREKFSEKWEKLRDVFKRKKEKKIKLILLGDSLVCGVGCDDSNHGNLSKISSIKSASSSSSQSLSLSGPVLPQIVAKVLSIAMRADVEWSSIGIVGGTVAELRSVLLPQIRRRITSPSVSSIDHLSSFPSLSSMVNDVDQNTEVFVVIICGLNDFKQITDHFPFNSGPAAFKEELGKLVEDIRLLGQELCLNLQVFLPAIPIVVGRGDPTCNIMIPPLSTFLEYIAYLWDEQKKAIAIENHERITYIDAPTMNKHYATPGMYVFNNEFCMYYVVFLSIMIK